MSLGRPTAIKLSEATVKLLCPINPSFEALLLAAWVELCKVQNMINELHSHSSDLYHSGEMLTNRLNLCEDALRRWDTDLSDNLRWSAFQLSANAPSLCVLQMMFCTTMLMLHRPPARYGKENPNENRFSQLGVGLPPKQDNFGTQTSREMCREYATRVSGLLDRFSKAYGPKHMSTLMNRIAFLTATTLVLHIVVTEPRIGMPCTLERSCLCTCLSFFDVLETQFPLSMHAKKSLQTLLRQCGLEIPPSSSESSASATTVEQGAAPWSDRARQDFVSLEVSDTDWTSFLPTVDFPNKLADQSQGVFDHVDSFAKANLPLSYDMGWAGLPSVNTDGGYGAGAGVGLWNPRNSIG